MAVSRWETFFKKAGIPSGPASDYAVIFTDNRMRMDMLNELNKEILADLGINVMGDVIAIMRHSKKVYAEISRSVADEFNVDGAKMTSMKKNERPDTKLTQTKIRPPAVTEKNSPAISLKSAAEKTGRAPDLVQKSSSKKKLDGKSLSARFGEFCPAAPGKSKGMNEVITISVPTNLSSAPQKAPMKRKPAAPKEQDAATSAKKTVFDRLGSISQEIVSKNEKTVPSSSQPTTNLDQSASSVFSRLGGSSFPQDRVKISKSPARLEPERPLSVFVDGSSRASVSRGSRDRVRPVKHVKPIPRKPLAMDLEENNTIRKSKEARPTNDKGLTSQTATLPDKSVFDRLGF